MSMDTNPTDHLDDETLSALLDSGDEHGHLAACERCSARLAELAGARAALAAAPVEPLDELARRRLVATAVRAAGEGGPAGDAGVAAGSGRSGWAQHHRAVLGSAAAVLLLVLVGVPFVVGRNGTTKQADKALSAQAPLAAPAQSAAGPFLGDLGDLTDHDRLRLRLSGVAADASAGSALAAGPAEPGPSPAAASAPTGGTPVPAGTPTGSGGAARSAAPAPPAAPPAGSVTGTAENGPAAFSANPASDRDRADADACVAALLNGPAQGGRLTGSGVGTWRGRPAVVAAFELNGGTVAFVADRSGCAVLDRFAL
jgi:hypothetical protein